MATFRYVKKDGSVGTFTAPDSATALKQLPADASKTSGVQLVPATTTQGAATVPSANKLPADQQKIVQSVYNATLQGDADTASRLEAAMKAASQYSSPYFKAQTRLATDALQRGLSSQEGDLDFAEKQQRAALDELRANTQASKGQLSFEHDKELQNLARNYETKLLDTRQNLAAAGFTSSSRRARTEGILAEENQGLVESSNKRFGYQTGNLDRNLAYQESGTSAQIENLRRLASEGKLDLLRSAEETVGSSALSGYSNLLGNIGGTIPRAQAQDQFQFASNFVF